MDKWLQAKNRAEDVIDGLFEALRPPLPFKIHNPNNPRAPWGGSMWMPPEIRREMAEKYGYWAVRRAEAALPRTASKADIERETKRLYEAWLSRLGGVPR